MKLEFENLITLIDAVSKSELTGFEYEANGVKLNLTKEKEQVQVVTAPQMVCTQEGVGGTIATTAVSTVQTGTGTETAAEAKELEGKVIVSPLVGTFYAAPAEDGPVITIHGTQPTSHVIRYMVITPRKEDSPFSDPRTACVSML